MQKNLSFFIYLLLWLPLQAQLPSLQTAQWQAKEVTKGVIWKTYHFDSLFGGPQCINILDIDLQKADIALSFAYLQSGEGFAKTSTFAKEAKALAAVNGSFFNMDLGGGVCLLKSAGQLVHPTDHDNAHWFYDDGGALALDEQGKAYILQKDSIWQDLEPFPEIMTSGPLLIYEQIALGLNSTLRQQHPRNAVGISKDQHLIFLVVDGKTKQSLGFNIAQLTQVMQALGCEYALNLDGGGSTTMWIKGTNETGIVNHPSGNGFFDHYGERKVANAVLITKK